MPAQARHHPGEHRWTASPDSNTGDGLVMAAEAYHRVLKVAPDHLASAQALEREVTYNNLEVFVRFLRAKVDGDGEAKLIHTERGLGYALRSPAC